MKAIGSRVPSGLGASPIQRSSGTRRGFRRAAMKSISSLVIGTKPQFFSQASL